MIIRLHIFVTIIFFFFFYSCKEDPVNIKPELFNLDIKGMDISFLPEIEATNTIFYDSAGVSKDFLDIIKENGVNTARIRLWNIEGSAHSGLEEVLQLVAKCRSHGFKIFLDFHYSDTWADPGAQAIPKNWIGLNVEQLEDSVYTFTKNIMSKIKPEYVQIGNEINGGMLWDLGKYTNEGNFVKLLKAGVRGSREASPESKIIIHYAGLEGSDYFFNIMKNASLDYDVIGLSYYPVWHGKSLALLETTIERLQKDYNKKVLIAEVSYPFTLQYADYTNNVLGLESQLVNGYAATKVGQQNFVKEIRSIVERTKSIGFCYWGGEWIAFKGDKATDGSSYENQALFDFQHKALPAFSAFH